MIGKCHIPAGSEIRVDGTARTLPVEDREKIATLHFWNRRRYGTVRGFDVDWL